MSNRVNNISRLVGLTLLLLIVTLSAQARGVYQTSDEFLQEVFKQQLPKSEVVWLKGEVRERTVEILGHNYDGLRIRFWRNAERSAWILEEVGKVEPITFGVVINQQQVEQVKVLAYRESRGWEVRHPAFTEQFSRAKLENNKLDTHIDGITGATLSVRAMTAVVTLALYLDEFTRKQS